MSEISREDLKNQFSTGVTADASDFEDLIDSSPNYTDDTGSFFRVFVSASSTSDARSLLNITAGGTVAAALDDLSDVNVAAASDNDLIIRSGGEYVPLSTGAIGREILAAAATASVHGHLGFGTVGIQVLTTEATSSLQSILGLSPTSLGEELIGASATASLRNKMGITVGPTIEITLSTTRGLMETTTMSFEEPLILSTYIECVTTSMGFLPGQFAGNVGNPGFCVYVSGDTLGLTTSGDTFELVTPAGTSRTVSAQALNNFKAVASVYKIT